MSYNEQFLKRKKLALGEKPALFAESVENDVLEDEELEHDDNWVALNELQPQTKQVELSDADLFVILQSAKEQINDIKASLDSIDESINSGLLSPDKLGYLKSKRFRTSKLLHHAICVRKNILFKFSKNKNAMPAEDFNELRSKNLERANANILLEIEKTKLASDLRIKEKDLTHERRLAEIEATKDKRKMIVTIQGDSLYKIRSGIIESSLTIDGIKVIVETCLKTIESL